MFGRNKNLGLKRQNCSIWRVPFSSKDFFSSNDRRQSSSDSIWVSQLRLLTLQRDGCFLVFLEHAAVEPRFKGCGGGVGTHDMQRGTPRDESEMTQVPRAAASKRNEAQVLLPALPCFGAPAGQAGRWEL